VYGLAKLTDIVSQRSLRARSVRGDRAQRRDDWTGAVRRHRLSIVTDNLDTLLSGPRRPWIQAVLAAMLPLLLVGSWVAYFAADHERADARRAASDTTTRVAERVSAELTGQLEVVGALASSTALGAGDLVAFREEVERVKPAHPLWFTVELTNPAGIQILNLLRPAGQPLGLTADSESFERALRTRRPVVGGIGPVGPVSGRRLVMLRVPVIRNGDIRSVLSVALAPDSVGKILREAGAPSSWIGVVVDASGYVVARTLAEGAEMGQPASAAVRAAIDREPSGLYRGRTLEGVETETVFRELPGTDGWTVHFGIPSKVLWGPVQRSLWLLAGGGLVGLALAGVLVCITVRDLAQRRGEERLRAKRALTASEERLATAIDAADLGTWRWDTANDEFYASDRCLELLGLRSPAPDRPAGRWHDVLAAVYPDDRRMLDDAVQCCLGEAALLDVEFRTLGQAGAGMPGWVRITGRRQAAGGEPASGLQGVMADVSARKRADAERLDLLRRLAGAQEDERRRISHELHDQVGQTVTGLALGLKALEASIGDTGERTSQVAWLRSLAAEIGRDIHRAAADLRPAALDDFGLDKALEALAADWGARYGVHVDVQVTGAPATRSPPEVEIVVYRVVQEALTNVLKHAEAHGVSVVLDHAPGQFRVIVEDDGKGFDLQAFDREYRARSHFGLSGMRERLARVGGTMMLESSHGSGTSVFIQIPLSPLDRPGAR
jgi:signal transduction histidine kinase